MLVLGRFGVVVSRIKQKNFIYFSPSLYFQTQNSPPKNLNVHLSFIYNIFSSHWVKFFDHTLEDHTYQK